MGTLQDQVFDYVREQGLLQGRDPWLLCVSGGADSMALMHFAGELRRRGHLADCVCVHFNHQLRGETADLDQAFVEAWAKKLAIRSITKTLPVRAFARENRLSIETAARDLRWRASAELMVEQGCSAIATGHQKDDNAETILDRISRGTGFRGLAGIWPRRTREACLIVRPILCLTRAEIRTYLAEQGFPWREDPSNEDYHFRRNAVRHRLLPHLQSISKTPLLDALARLSSACQNHHEHTEKQASVLRPQTLTRCDNGVHLDARRLAEEPPWVALELVRQALAWAGCGERDLTSKHYGRILAMLGNNQDTGSLNLPTDLRASRAHNTLTIAPVHPADAPPGETAEFHQALHWPGTTQFGSFSVHVSLLDPQQAEGVMQETSQDRCVEFFDSDLVERPLSLRLPLPTDRFHPLGWTGPQKLAKFLAKQKRGPRSRRCTLVMCDAQSIIWVWPVRLSQSVRVTGETRQVARVEIQRRVSRP